MFERFTEKARRVIFFARYEGSAFGSPFIETEHILLGLLREDRTLGPRFSRAHASMESIRKQIEKRRRVGKKVSTSVDLPLSQESKRVLAYAAEEAERLNHKHIGTEHVLLGLLREQKCFAAEILRECQVEISELRVEFARKTFEPGILPRPVRNTLLGELTRDLTQAAAEDELDPLIGREAELERVIQILSRRNRNNVALIGERGVGKRATAHGLARRIVGAREPAPLAEKRLLALELSPILTILKASERVEEGLRPLLQELVEETNVIFFIEGLFAPTGAEGTPEMPRILKQPLSRSEIQCVAAATPAEYQSALQKEPWLEECFHTVALPAPSEPEAIKILFAVKHRYEKFHSITYTHEALKHAVYHSQRFMPGRFLPDKAIDLIDEAGAAVAVRKSPLPEEVVKVQKRLRFIVDRMKSAIANQELEKAKFCSQVETKERKTLRKLTEKYGLDAAQATTVGLDDIEEAVASWTGMPIATIRQERKSDSGSREADIPG